MSKSTVTSLFVGSLIAIAGGFVLCVVVGLLAYTSGAFVMNGPDVVGVRSTASGWAVGGAVAIAVLAMIGGGIGQFVAWIGAVLNTAQLEDKTWFLVILLLGVLSFGFVAMLVYILAGPDGTAPAPRTRAAVAQPV